MGQFKVTIVETTKKIEGKINQALRKDLDKKMTRAANKMIRPVRNLIGRSLRSQPEYDALDNGRLAGHFGLPDGRARIDRIIDAWVNNITIKAKRSFFRSGQLSAGLHIDIVQRDYADVLALDAATIITEKGQSLPWLEWLLKFGDRTIIRDFEISFSPVGRTRSGLAVMVSEPGGRWGVPSQYAGTQRNNFCTRALDEASDALREIIINTIRTTVT